MNKKLMGNDSSLPLVSTLPVSTENPVDTFKTFCEELWTKTDSENKGLDAGAVGRLLGDVFDRVEALISVRDYRSSQLTTKGEKGVDKAVVVKAWKDELVVDPKTITTQDAFAKFVDLLVTKAGGHKSRNFKIVIIAFVNSAAGGGQGVKVFEKLKKLLGPEQVFDLKADKGPGVGLEKWRRWPNLRIICGGGDGTVSWVLAIKDKMDFKVEPSVVPLPLGTANDTSRVMKWGPGYKGEKLKPILEQIEKAMVMKYDRWLVKTNELTQEEATELKKKLEEEGKLETTDSEEDDLVLEEELNEELNEALKEELKEEKEEKEEEKEEDPKKGEVKEKRDRKRKHKDSKASEPKDKEVGGEEDVKVTIVKSSGSKGKGSKGDKGEKVEKAEKEEKGEPGEPGETGETAEKGDKGSSKGSKSSSRGKGKDTGNKGDAGDKGDKGEGTGDKESSRKSSRSDRERGKKELRSSHKSKEGELKPKEAKTGSESPSDAINPLTSSLPSSPRPPRPSTSSPSILPPAPLSQDNDDGKEDKEKSKDKEKGKDKEKDKEEKKEKKEKKPKKKQTVGDKEFVANNYFSIGIDSKMLYEFEQMRKKHPGLFPHRNINFGWYGLIGMKNMMVPYKELRGICKLWIDGEEKKLPKSLQCIVMMNVPSYSGGTNPWDNPSDAKRVPDKCPQSINDGIIEVFGMRGAAHLGRNVAHISRGGYRLGQGSVVKILTLEAVAGQVDVNMLFNEAKDKKGKIRDRLSVLNDDPEESQ